MADNKTKSKVDILAAAANGFNKMPLLRQVFFMGVLALSIALGVSLVIWMQEPEYRPLYSNLSFKETGEVADALQKAAIPYKISNRDGTVLVPSKDVYQARMKVASAGVSVNSSGFESLSKSSSIGTSRFMENARYRHALEIELSRTIAEIKGVRNARVHLAIPNRSVFVSDDKKPTASVFVNLASGSKLESEQVSAIVQLVASSITNLSPSSVTVTDQYGRLLTPRNAASLALTKSQFNYQKNLETYYENQIESMIAPIVGASNVRVRVSANVDFTHQEQTKEEYQPEGKTIRSEQSVTEKGAASGGGGVPGAASNQPGGEGGKKAAAGGTSRNQSVKNYEVNKSLSYKRSPVGELENLSVAVVVDNVTKVDPKTKKVTTVPVPKQKLDKITNLVKAAIGFNAKRGDKVSVVNTSFVPPPKIEAPPPLPMWKQPWVLDAAKKGGGVLIALMLLFGMLRPMLKNLAAKSEEEPEKPVSDDEEAEMLSPQMMELKQEQLKSLQAMAQEDPARVANVLKTWVGNE